MKIKCKKCGKHFDPAMYSGLCPKCGTYNGKHMAETDDLQYADGGYSAEAEHQKLHDRYSDTGHAQDAHRQLHETYDQSYETAHPAQAASAQERAGRSRGSLTLTAVLVVMIFLLPFLFLGIYAIWEGQAVRKYMTVDIGQVPLTDGHTIIFSGEEFRAPVEVSILGMDIIERAELTKEGKVLAVVRGRAASEAYSYDARVNGIALKYETGGNTCYQEPLDDYYLEFYLYGFGLSRDDVLTAYSVGNGTEQEGYWFFCIPSDAQSMELSVMASRESSETFLEGTIPLEDVVSAGLMGEDAE